MAVRDLHRVEQVAETVRAVLEALAVAAPAWLSARIPEHWYVRYGQRGDDWRLPKGVQARTEFAVEVGRDGFWLLDTVYSDTGQPWLAQLEAVEILRMTWMQQYYRDRGSIRWRDKDFGLPFGARIILSPYDLDARPGIKRGRNWRGYKAHFTETCDRGQPHVVVHVATTDGSTADMDTVESRHNDLAAVDLLPAQHFADRGYVSVGHILAARDQHSIELIGPLPPDTSWQAADPEAFDLTKFHIDWEAKHVVCPNGKVSRNWQHALSRDGLPLMRATFRLPDCRPCPDLKRCTRSEDNARHITFLPRRQLETQRQLRAEQSTKEWQQRYAVRSGVESLIAQASRRSNIHQARYRGKPKTFLQHTLTAMAINLTRIDAWLTGDTSFGSWTSRLTRLAQALAAPG